MTRRKQRPPAGQDQLFTGSSSARRLGRHYARGAADRAIRAGRLSPEHAALAATLRLAAQDLDDRAAAGEPLPYALATYAGLLTLAGLVPAATGPDDDADLAAILGSAAWQPETADSDTAAAS